MDTDLLSMLPFLVAVAFMLYQVAHRPDGVTPRCPRCGYDLRATPGRCPECGEAGPASNVR
jgi:tRNA(Ile2) C34 agmatinyltransferase TiaS